MGILKERTILINTDRFKEFEEWDLAGQPIIDSIPKNYGIAQKRKFAKVDVETSLQRHARLDPNELLELRIEKFNQKKIEKVEALLLEKVKKIDDKRAEILNLRKEIDRSLI